MSVYTSRRKQFTACQQCSEMMERERKRGWLPIPAFSHREPPFCVAALYYLFFAPFLAAFFGAAFFLAPPFFAVAILCISFR